MEKRIEGSMAISKLIVGYMRKTLTDRERQTLELWLAADPKNKNLFEDVTTASEIENYRKQYESVDTNQALALLNQRIQAHTVSEIPVHKGKGWKVWVLRAAAILVVATFGVFLYLNTTGSRGIAPTSSEGFVNDIAPGGNRATLVISNGKKIELSENKTGIVVGKNGLTYDDGTQLQDGEIAFEGNSGVPRQAHNVFLELTTPRGGQYQATLPDGSKVWLNAASSLKYPARFTKKERVVELIGEAYFEIMHNSEKAFIVKSAHQEVKVLGTHFNINSYGDNRALETTLLEGSVLVSNTLTGLSKRLSPGQQSIVAMDGKKFQVRETDIEEAIAWKNGYFKFNNESIESLMKKVSRWYDVDVYYQDKINPDLVFSGRMSKYDSVSGVLDALELTGGVQFKIEERRITVMK